MRTLFVVVAFAAALLTACSFSRQPAMADSVVKIIVGAGHGSGVHIGDGYIISASHVVGTAEKVELKTSSGGEAEAVVLWANKAYDIALLRVSDRSGLGMSRLACTVPSVGDEVIAKGNPINAEFITVWGRIADSVREAGPWKSVVITDIATVPGQSGGGVFDTQGRLIGITVGVMVAPVGFSASLVGVGYVVPGRVVCDLLARGA